MYDLRCGNGLAKTVEGRVSPLRLSGYNIIGYTIQRKTRILIDCDADLTVPRNKPPVKSHTALMVIVN